MNIGSNEGHSINDIIAHLKMIAEEEVNVKYVASRKADVANMILDTTKLKEYVHFEPTPLKAGMKAFYEETKARRA